MGAQPRGRGIHVVERDHARPAQSAIRPIRDARPDRHAGGPVAGVVDAGVTGAWPHNGEIDIMEYYRGTLLANVAWGGATPWEPVGRSCAGRSQELRRPRWSSEFHVWRMDWDEQTIVLSVDGELLNTVELTRTVNGMGRPRTRSTAALPAAQPGDRWNARRRSGGDGVPGAVRGRLRARVPAHAVSTWTEAHSCRVAISCQLSGNLADS